MSTAAGATPRVTQQHLQQYVNKTVRVVGRVTELRGDTAIIDAEGSITVHLNQDSHLRPNFAAEIIGKVKSDGSISVMQGTNFGENFDYAAANAVVAVTHKYPELFTAAPNMSEDGRVPIPAISHSNTHTKGPPAIKIKSGVVAEPSNVSNGTFHLHADPMSTNTFEDAVVSSSNTMRPLSGIRSFASDAQLLVDELDDLKMDAEPQSVSAVDTFQDAQLLVDEIEAFELSQSLRTSKPDISFEGAENGCSKHSLCNMRYEKQGLDYYEVHELDGEEQWVWVAKPPREKRRKSYV